MSNDHNHQQAPVTAYPPAPPQYATAPPPMGYATQDGPVGYPYPQQAQQTTSRGGFWKGCFAALCCCCVLDCCF